VFGELVFNRGPAGLGTIWSFAGVGLLCGGVLAHTIGRRLSFTNYKRSIAICYVVHGGSYILFSQMRSFTWALVFIALSRAGVGFSSVMNMSQLLRCVPNAFRGRVFATMESTTWSVMMISMMLAGIAFRALGPAHHRHDCGSAQLHHRGILGLGALHGQAARAGARGRGAGGG